MSWSEAKEYYDLAYKKYKWRVSYSATNGFGATVTNVVYVTSGGKSWSPDELSDEVLYKGKNVKKLSKTKLAAIKKKIKAINYEYY